MSVNKKRARANKKLLEKIQILLIGNSFAASIVAISLLNSSPIVVWAFCGLGGISAIASYVVGKNFFRRPFSA